MRFGRFVVFCALVGSTFVGKSASAEDDPCGGFKWDLSAERALFAGTSAAVSAGKSPGPGPALDLSRLYRLQLSPQSEVTFAAEPGKATPAEESFAGLAVVNIETAGRYRVAVDQPLWIDVAADGSLAPVEDFQGQHACDAPRKVVAFELRGPKRWTLQLSGALRPAARLTVTRVPPDRTH